MKKYIILCILAMSFSALSETSMRRCTLLPVTDSVGGAIGTNVFKSIEIELKRSNWCTYVSNADMIHVFSRYKDNLSQHIKQKEVLRAVGEKLNAGSLIYVSIKHELNGVDIALNIFGSNGEDLYFSEVAALPKDNVEIISETILNWLDVYSKTIPYDAQVIGVIGEQITLDVGRGYPIQIGQTFDIKRMTHKRKHPLFRKIVDWDSKSIAEGSVDSISENQALGIIRQYNTINKAAPGDWVILKEKVLETKLPEDVIEEGPGSLGIFSLAFIGASSTFSTVNPTDSPKMNGILAGISLNVEAWITREFFASLGIERTIGSLSKSSGSPKKNNISANNGSYKFLGGYKYLPIGFFYGPQVNFYTGYIKHNYDFESSKVDGFGNASISGIALGVSGNIPLNREYKIFARAEFLPFPSFSDGSGIYGTASSVSSMDLELGVKYQYTARITLDGSFETQARKAKFKDDYKEYIYRDNRFKFGASFNF